VSDPIVREEDAEPALVRIRAGDSRRRRPGLGMFGLCLGTALIIMEANVVNVAVPTIRAELHTSATTSLWVLDSYTLLLAVLLLSAGRAGDRIGARRCYLLGLGVFGLASVGCSLAGTATLLVAARAVQGIGAALLVPAPLTLITWLYPEAAARARAVSVWVTVGGLGFCAGPLLGGLLLDTLGWRSIFLLNVPVVLGTGWLVRRYVAETPRRRVGFDAGGQLLAVLGLGGVVFSLVQSSLAGWRSPSVLAALTGGLVVLALLVATQLRRGRVDPDVLLPPSILRARPVLAGLLGGFAYNFALYGMLLVYTFDLQSLRHYSALRTGLALLPLTVAAAAGTILLGGRFVARRGPRPGLAVGMGLAAVGLAVLTVGAGDVPYLVVAAGFTVFAAGLSFAAPAQTLAVMTFAPDEHRNVASSALNAARQTGGVIGVALLGALAANDLVTGTPRAMAVAVATCLLAALVALRFVPASPESSPSPSPTEDPRPSGDHDHE
jgi:DHA2 family methylenomycin A resistance protein-like MFS transporter